MSDTTMMIHGVTQFGKTSIKTQEVGEGENYRVFYTRQINIQQGDRNLQITIFSDNKLDLLEKETLDD